MSKSQTMMHENVDRDRIILENIALVRYIAIDYVNSTNNIPFIDIDDLISVGVIGLIKGVDTYNQDKGVKLGTYLGKCINNEILMYLRRFKRRKTEISLDEPLYENDKGRKISRIDLLSGDDKISELMYKYELSDIVRYLLSKLNDIERTVISLRYGFTGKPLTQYDVAKLLNTSQPYISKIERLAIRKLCIIYDLRADILQ